MAGSELLDFATTLAITSLRDECLRSPSGTADLEGLQRDLLCTAQGMGASKSTRPRWLPTDGTFMAFGPFASPPTALLLRITHNART